MTTNDITLAQWKVERGDDMQSNAWGLFLGVLFTVPPLAILLLPFTLYYAHKGKVLEREGRHEGGEGRPLVKRGSRFIAPNARELRYDDGMRRVEAPLVRPK